MLPLNGTIFALQKVIICRIIELMNKPYKHIVFFDGVCNLCNSTVDFLMKHNSVEDLYFSSLQSPFALNFFKQYKISLQQLSTIYFFKDGMLYQKSEAALHIAQHLNKPYKYIAVFSFLPTGFSNIVYNFVAKNRYRWFGKNDTCRIPTANELKRFLEH